MNHRSILVLVVFLILVEFALQIFGVPDYFLPRPSQVFSTFWEERSTILPALEETSIHTLLALGISFCGGSLLAILISLSSWLRAGVLPLALFFQTVPIIAIAPMLVIWFGFGSPTVVASATIVSFFPILAATLQGLESTSKSSQELFQLYRASTIQLYKKLKIPQALPWIYSGLRIATGLAVVGAIVGEFIGGGGIGSLIDSARTQQRANLVFAGVLASCALGLALTFALDCIKNTLFKAWFQK